MMEVSGKRNYQNNLSASLGAAEDFVLFCIPCDSEGAREPAYGYCKNCQEHLCETCFKTHKKPAPLRNHVLLDKESMPSTPSVSNAQDDFESCSEHGDEKQKFYCRDHIIVVCSICVTLEHRVCKVEYIPKLSKNILEGSDLQDLIAEIKALEDHCNFRIKKTKQSMNSLVQNHNEILQEVRRFRKELNTRLDEMELSIIKETDSLVNAQQKSLEKLSGDLEDITKEIVDSEVCVENLQRNHLDILFVEMGKAKNRFKELAAKERDIDQISELQNLKFVKNQAVLEILQNQKQLGKLKDVDITSDRFQGSTLTDSSTPSEDKTIELELIGEINVELHSDKEESNITGMEVVQPDRIVVCDTYNKKLKCYNTDQGNVVLEKKFDNYPFDVTSITGNKYATTVPCEKSIYVMSLTSTGISSDRRINVEEECRGIAYSQDKLIVSCNMNPGKVIILDLIGKILHTFDADNLVSFPYYIIVNTTGTYIYVSDCNHKAVKQLDWKGGVVNIYREEKNGTRLGGICELDDGTFLVCLSVNDKDSVVRISSSCKPSKVTRHEKLWVWFPKAVTYCKKTQRLYVSYSENGSYGPFNHIQVFKVDWR